MKGRNGARPARSGIVLLLAITALLDGAPRPAAAQDPPRALRNEVARAGRELLVLRHQKLAPGTHQRYLELNRDGVWPFWEKLGVRIVGQWKVIHPEGGGDAGLEEGYRLARYRGIDHWLASREPERLGGNGPDAQASAAAIEARERLVTGSDGAIFLEGEMGPGGPYHLPSSNQQPVRNELPRATGGEIVTLRSFRIKKGSFEEFNRLSREGVWPYFEKIGARAIGQWKRVYPQIAQAARPGAEAPDRESPDYDEAYMMFRYASYEHWKATRGPEMAKLGGDGPDYQACAEALRRRGELTISSEVRFLEGYLHHTVPLFMPAVD